ncbi:MAG: hypothetical protein GY716_15795 [bacterium]|nr:hypothetical protein [bacterium]
MPHLNETHDPSQHSPTASRELVSTAWYACEITGTGYKPNSKGTGTVISVNFRVLEGPRAGAGITCRINYTHTNPTTQSIGRGDLTAVQTAVGHMQPISDTEVLHGKRCDVYAKLREPRPKNDGSGTSWPASNDTDGFAPFGTRSQDQSQIDAQAAPIPTFDTAPAAPSNAGQPMNVGQAAAPPVQQAAPATVGGSGGPTTAPVQTQQVPIQTQSQVQQNVAQQPAQTVPAQGTVPQQAQQIAVDPQQAVIAPVQQTQVAQTAPVSGPDPNNPGGPWVGQGGQQQLPQ